MERVLNKYKEIISGAVLLLFTVFYMFENSKIKTLEKGLVNAQFFPKVLGIALFVLSVLQIVSGIREVRAKAASKAEANVEVKKFNKQRVVSVVLTLISLSIYIMLLKTVGFLIMTFVYLFVQMIILTPKGKRNYLMILILSASFAAGIYFIFVSGFQLLLPRGIL